MFAILDRLDGGEMVGLGAILAAAAVVILVALIIGWASMSASKQQADLKREMLQRGLSVGDIDLLTMSEAVRQAQIQADQKVKEAQINADLRRDLAARGVSLEQLASLGPVSASDAGVLAATICSMVQDGELDRDAVAKLIEAFLRRGSPPPAPTSTRILADDRALGRRDDGA